MGEPLLIRSREMGGVSGLAVGILHVAAPFAFVPGNIQNATTLHFPAAYECVTGVTLDDVLNGTSSLEVGLLFAAKRLEERGVRAIIGACGSFANFQRSLTKTVTVPVYSSILTQVPWLIHSLPASQKLCIVFANRKSFTPRVFEECKIESAERLVITDCMSLPPFTSMLAEPFCVNSVDLEHALVEHLRQVIQEQPSIGAIMLQCSELPPYAAAIQAELRLPVFDVVTLAEFVFSSVVRTPYRGYI